MFASRRRVERPGQRHTERNSSCRKRASTTEDAKRKLVSRASSPVAVGWKWKRLVICRKAGNRAGIGQRKKRLASARKHPQSAGEISYELAIPSVSFCPSYELCARYTERAVNKFARYNSETNHFQRNRSRSFMFYQRETKLTIRRTRRLFFLSSPKRTRNFLSKS